MNYLLYYKFKMKNKKNLSSLVKLFTAIVSINFGNSRIVLYCLINGDH